MDKINTSFKFTDLISDFVSYSNNVLYSERKSQIMCCIQFSCIFSLDTDIFEQEGLVILQNVL